jgi:hypothetical protein
MNGRKAYKLTKHCVICGSTDHIEYHDLKHMIKVKVEGFLQLMNPLNRKQIPVCREYHRKIHNELYDEEY